MKDNLKNEYIVVETDSDLKKVVKEFKKKDVIAVDMEADSMFHFKEKVCLIQMAVFNYPNVIIDTLKVNDLLPLKPLFADLNIKKIFHGADFDIRSLYRDYGIVINNIFDTEIGSRYIGRKETGLAAVIADRFDVKLEKKYQKKDWSQRPLPKDMLEYSAGDVNFLLPLEQILKKELIEKNRLDWVLEECELLSNVRPAKQNKDCKFLKVKGAGRLKPKNLAILEELLKLREDIAKKKDKPLFKIIGTDSLLQLALKFPDNLKHLKKLHLISQRQFSMYGKFLINAIQKGIDIKTDNLPIYPKTSTPNLSMHVPSRISVLKKWRDSEAIKLDLDPSLLLTKYHLTAIAIKNPATLDELQQIEALKNWQKNEFGEKIIQALKNEI